MEMACGAALAAVYSGLIRRLQEEGESAITWTASSLLRSNKMAKIFPSFHAETMKERLFAATASCLFPGRLPAPLGPLLVIVCGGSSVDMQQLANLKVKLQA